MDELVEERLRRIQAGTWPPELAELLVPMGGPWWDDGDELQGAFHLEELQRVWRSLHGEPPGPPARWRQGQA